MMTLLLLTALLATAIAAPQPLKRMSPDTFIIQGDPATPHQIPWQGSLQGRWQGDHLCGCAYLTAGWAITAAHCIVNNQASNLQVVFGLHRQSQQADVYRVSRLIAHPSFVWDASNGFPNDIGLIQTQEWIIAEPGRVESALLPGSWDNFEGQTCIISGWGMDEFGSYPDELQVLDVEVLSHQECVNEFGPFKFHDFQVCLRGMPQGSSCSGDSGGPLSCGGVVAGVSSFTVTNCPANRPAVYTKVSYYIQWINQYIWT